MMNFCKWKIRLFIPLGISLCASIVNASEPLPEAKIKIHVDIKSDRIAEVAVENLEEEHAAVDLALLHHGPLPHHPNQFDGFSAHLPIIHPPIHLGVPSHQVVREKFDILPPNDGIMVVHFQSKIALGNQKVKNGPSIYQIYEKTPNGFKEVSFEEAFLKRRFEPLKPNQNFKEAELALGGGYTAQIPIARLAFKPHSLDSSEISKIEHVKLGSPLEMANKFALKHLPEVSARARSPQNESELDFLESLRENSSSLQLESQSERVEGFALEREEDRENEVNLQSKLTIKGHMSTKYDDGSFHAAWGWVVTAWQWSKIGPTELYLPLGWTYVNGDGSWTIPLASFATQSNQVYIQYQTANRFVQLQDPAGHIYTWGDWWKLTGSTTDIGYRYADLSTNGDLPGIDKLYEGATEEWSKFYYNGLNALRDKPIQVTYPNSLASGHCIENKDANGNSVKPYAWSCSEWSSGKIWIIPAHGDKTVIQHEAAHSINSFYWNGNLSSGAGGAHSLDGCYNGGLALTEGFADFIPYWVQFDRNAANPVASYLNENIETYNGDNNCSSGEINEMRVASTFWDMYDVKNDGPNSTHYDGWYYIDQASPVALYLKNGTHQKMSEYLPIVDAGDKKWFEADRALFRLNKIIP